MELRRRSRPSPSDRRFRISDVPDVGDDQVGKGCVFCVESESLGGRRFHLNRTRNEPRQSRIQVGIGHLYRRIESAAAAVTRSPRNRSYVISVALPVESRTTAIGSQYRSEE